MMRSTDPVVRQPDPDNVFAAMGLPDPDLRLAKATLGAAAQQRIEALGPNQTQAAERMGVSQPDVSRMPRGRLAGYTLDRLARCLNSLGVDVEIVVHPPADEVGKVRSTWVH